MVILALLAVIGGPIIINECYKGDSGYIAIWSAADTLSYYGTVLGALVAAATIAVTIIFTRKQLQRESFLKSETEKWSNIERIIELCKFLLINIKLFLFRPTQGIEPTAYII